MTIIWSLKLLLAEDQKQGANIDGNSQRGRPTHRQTADFVWLQTPRSAGIDPNIAKGGTGPKSDAMCTVVWQIGGYSIKY